MFWVLSRTPDDTRLTYRVNSIYTFAFPRFLWRMRKTHLYINGGGSLMQDVTSTRSLWYYCYTLRAAKKRGCNKIALGHHYDDAIGTVLMGLIYGGQVQAMLPRVKAKNYEGMELIRPLYFTREANVVEWAEFCGLTFLPCDCPAKKLENDTKRAEIKQLIASLASKNPQIEANIFNAVKNVDTGKLLGWRDENGRHSFLDRL